MLWILVHAKSTKYAFHYLYLDIWKAAKLVSLKVLIVQNPLLQRCAPTEGGGTTLALNTGLLFSKTDNNDERDDEVMPTLHLAPVRFSW